MVVDQMPTLGDCNDRRPDERGICTTQHILEFIQANVNYPPMARDAGITGTVFVYFVVGKDGKVKDAKVLREVDAELDDEALRVVRSLPDFDPGKQRGKPVSVQFTTVVKFEIY